MIDLKKHLPYFTAALGFALAWFLKPVSDPFAGGDSTNRPTDNEPRVNAHRIRTADTVTTPRGSDMKLPLAENHENLPAELVEMRNQMFGQLNDGLATRDHGFVSRMTELLGLNAEQASGMLRLLNQKRQAFSVLAPKAAQGGLLERAEQAETQYHQALGQLLEPSQVAKYNDYKKQQAQNRALARAQTAYADVLEKIDISEDQRAAVELALRDASISDQPSLDKTSALFEAYDTMGYGAAAATMAASSVTNAAIDQSTDKAQRLQELVKSRQRESSTQLEALRPILTTAQWEQYKATIDAKDRSFYLSIQPLMSAAPVDLEKLYQNADD